MIYATETLVGFLNLRGGGVMTCCACSVSGSIKVIRLSRFTWAGAWPTCIKPAGHSVSGSLSAAEP